ncbi:MAG: hypothetical protein IKL04_00730, partial [Lachnospiraceae bacterium]|nr:hypothetical protein [Lachnospiraceae bacterium]
MAGTLVHTAEGIRPIEEVAPGDYVLAYNEETGETGYKQVLHLFHNTTEELTYVEVAGADTITCTPGHKFYVEGEWLSACELQ